MPRMTTASLSLLTAAALICLPAVTAFSEAPADSYGDRAYSFLETFTGLYPSRVNEEFNRSQADLEAGLWIKSRLEDFGYTVESQDYVHFNYTGTNYYVTKPGASDKIVCVGAHYDSADTGGVDDNGSGVSVLLELAERFADLDTACTLQFVFFDNEENGGYVGSCNFINRVLMPQELLDDVLCFINIDSVGAGDRLYAYGGVYEEDGSLTKIWPFQMAHAAADIAGIDLYALPGEVAQNPDESLDFRTPARDFGSDHYYFMTNGIPYVYFEASLWCDEDGGGGNDETRLTCHYQTANPAFASTGGQIMHTEFDNLQQINELLPGRLRTNLSNTSRIISSMLTEITEQTPADMDGLAYRPEDYEVVPTTATPEGSHEETTAQTTAEETPTAPRPQTVISSNHSLILIIFGFAAAVIMLLIGFVIYTSSAGRRRRKRRRRYNSINKKNAKKKKNKYE